MDKKTRIICTIGPTSENKEILNEMIEKGMNMARLNFSHGSHDEHFKRIEQIRKLSKLKGKDISIILDTKGLEIRTGSINPPLVNLLKGQQFKLISKTAVGNETFCSTTYQNLYKEVYPGCSIFIDDGLIELKVKEIIEDDIITEVMNNGTLKGNKGINLPGVKILLPTVTKKDRDDIIFGIKNGIDFIAASFVCSKNDISTIKSILRKYHGEHIKIIAKIENEQGVKNLDEILAEADGIMIGRGDLGIEMNLEEIPFVQKEIINKCKAMGKMVITATQMLDSMIRYPRPTRAEVTDVANAILDGTDAIMLSGETADGLYPLEALEIMNKIARKAEQSELYKNSQRNQKKNAKKYV